MALAIAVSDVVKEFGKPGGSYWKQVFGSQTNGEKPVVMDVDDVSNDVQEGD